MKGEIIQDLGYYALDCGDYLAVDVSRFDPLGLCRSDPRPVVGYCPWTSPKSRNQGNAKPLPKPTSNAWAGEYHIEPGVRYKWITFNHYN